MVLSSHLEKLLNVNNELMDINTADFNCQDGTNELTAILLQIKIGVAILWHPSTDHSASA